MQYLKILPQFLLFFSPIWAFGVPNGPILLAIGEQTSVPIQAQSKFSVGNPEVIKVRATNAGPGRALLLIRAKRQGYSDLVILHRGKEQKFTFRVHTKKNGALLREVKTALKGAEGLEVLPQGNSYVVRGKANSVSDHNLLEVYAANGKGKVHRLAGISDVARQVAEQKIRRVFRDANLGTIEVHGAGSQIWLSGTVLQQSKKELAIRLAQQEFYSVVSNIKVPFESKQRVRFKIHILELVKVGQGKVGMQWSESLPNLLEIHKRLTRTNFSLDASLNFLNRKGDARILARPVIVMNELGVAELKVGGEIPIPIITRKRRSIHWKSYGLKLRIEIPGSSKELVRTKIKVELSSLDPAVAIDGIPGIKVNRLDTLVDLSMNKTIFLSGLIQDESGSTTSSVPLLGDIPLLGNLFKSREYRSRKTELVIAVTALKAGG